MVSDIDNSLPVVLRERERGGERGGGERELQQWNLLRVGGRGG